MEFFLVKFLKREWVLLFISHAIVLRAISLSCAGILLFGACGVKAPPIAPEQVRVDHRKLDCSPYDSECDKTDPNYVPRKKSTDTQNANQ